MTESTIDNDRERRALALNLACALHKDSVRFDDRKDQSLGQAVLADAKAFEAFVRTGRIPASHRLKDAAPRSADG